MEGRVNAWNISSSHSAYLDGDVCMMDLRVELKVNSPPNNFFRQNVKAKLTFKKPISDIPTDLRLQF